MVALGENSSLSSTNVRGPGAGGHASISEP